jgi:hypothetical protein
MKLFPIVVEGIKPSSKRSVVVIHVPIHGVAFRLIELHRIDAGQVVQHGLHGGVHLRTVPQLLAPVQDKYRFLEGLEQPGSLTNKERCE